LYWGSHNGGHGARKNQNVSQKINSTNKEKFEDNKRGNQKF